MSGQPSLFGDPFARETRKLESTEPPCPECKGPTVERHGRQGAFFGCLRFPKCRGIAQPVIVQGETTARHVAGLRDMQPARGTAAEDGLCRDTRHEDRHEEWP